MTFATQMREAPLGAAACTQCRAPLLRRKMRRLHDGSRPAYA
jgi:hypothetical protein